VVLGGWVDARGDAFLIAADDTNEVPKPSQQSADGAHSPPERLDH